MRLMGWGGRLLGRFGRGLWWPCGRRVGGLFCGRTGGGAGVVAALGGEDGVFVLWARGGGWTKVVALGEGGEISMSEGEWEVVHVVPLGGGEVAGIGLGGMMNAGGGIVAERFRSANG